MKPSRAGSIAFSTLPMTARTVVDVYIVAAIGRLDGSDNAARDEAS